LQESSRKKVFRLSWLICPNINLKIWAKKNSFCRYQYPGRRRTATPCQKFYDYIHENEINLSNLKFGILALGDSSYPQFCKTGEDVDSRFEILGAQRIIPLKKCDIDYEQEASHWIEHVFETVNKAPIVLLKAVQLQKPTGRKNIRERSHPSSI
jgi:sulfite reductase alpha subunit-like flavoprotein